MIGKKILAFLIEIVLFVVVFIILLIIIYTVASLFGIPKPVYGWIENIFVIGMVYFYFYLLPKRIGNSLGRKILKIPPSTWKLSAKLANKKTQRAFLITAILTLLVTMGVFFYYEMNLIETRAKSIALLLAFLSAGSIGVWIHIKARIYQDVGEILTTGKVTFKGFGKGKFPQEHLSKPEILKVTPQKGYWLCPSCNENNREMQDICSNCGQEVEKPETA